MIQTTKEHRLPGDYRIAENDDGTWLLEHESGHDLDDATLPACLDHAEQDYRDMAATGRAGLEAVARIRAAERLGVLRWEKSEDSSCLDASFGSKPLIVRFGIVTVYNTMWAAVVVGGHHTRIHKESDPDDIPAAVAACKAACERWLAEWLEAAGLEVKRG